MSSAPINEEHLKITHLDELDDEKRGKAINLREKFEKLTSRRPEFIVCAPGRVNIIGDHVDYHGFAVLPMAIKNSVWLACSFSRATEDTQAGDKGRISLLNAEDDSFEPFEGKHSFSHALELYKSHRWHNYFFCAYYGVLASKLLKINPNNVLKHSKELACNTDRLVEADLSVENLEDLLIVVDSDLPKASGLSSSSALVCASAVASTLLLGRSQPSEDLINVSELAEACSKFEHLVGTHGGGMDQAVILTAQEDYAKYVQFVPRLSCENVHLPNDVDWLISHCGADYPKAATSGFNTRVLETKLAAALIAKHQLNKVESSGIRVDLDSSITLAKVRKELFKETSTQELVVYIRKEVFDGLEELDVDQICTRLELTRNQLIEQFHTSDEFLKNTLGNKLKLLNRCEHVLEEAERVERFKSICDTTVDVALLGQLMTQSHYSLRDKYDCSHPALDRLVGVALEAGALGCRLTGAGWGGCVVTLVESAKTETVLERLTEVSKFTFRTRPESGCEVIKISK